MPVQLNATTGGGNVTITAPSSVTGTKTLTVPGVNGNIITSADSGTVTQTMLGTNVAGNGPAFFAYPSANTTITSSYTSYLVSVNTKTSPGFDTNTCFNNTGSTVTLNGLSVPAYAFCPNVAGYYFVTHGGVLTDASSSVFSMVYKNAVIYSYSAPGGIVSGSALNSAAEGACLVYLNGTGDYIQLYYSTTNASKTMAGNNTSQAFFQAAMVRSA